MAQRGRSARRHVTQLRSRRAFDMGCSVRGSTISRRDAPPSLAHPSGASKFPGPDQPPPGVQPLLSESRKKRRAADTHGLHPPAPIRWWNPQAPLGPTRSTASRPGAGTGYPPPRYPRTEVAIKVMSRRVHGQGMASVSTGRPGPRRPLHPKIIRGRGPRSRRSYSCENWGGQPSTRSCGRSATAAAMVDAILRGRRRNRLCHGTAWPPGHQADNICIRRRGGRRHRFRHRK